MVEKLFVYCMSEDGGMSDFKATGVDDLLNQIPLFSADNSSDAKLKYWAENCSIGKFCDHRLGIAFRVTDFNEF
jgi:hypothetical protein